MKLRTTAVIGALVVGSFLFLSSKALAQAVCGAHAKVKDNLRETYAEAPVSVGVTTSGAVIEVFASPQGTWTLVLTQPNGLSCLIAAGQDWESLPKKLTADHT